MQRNFIEHNNFILLHFAINQRKEIDGLTNKFISMQAI